MARPSLKEEEIEAFRSKICQVALRLFAENGFDSVTMRAIASEADCSPAKPYSYFEDKEAIFAATRSRCFDDFCDYMESKLAGIDDPEEALRVQGHGYLAFARQQPHAFQIMFDLDQAPAESYPDLRASIGRSWSILVGTVQEAIDAGVVEGDADSIAGLLWSGVHGIAALEQAGTPGPDWEPEALTTPMIESLIDAHRPDRTREPNHQ